MFNDYYKYILPLWHFHARKVAHILMCESAKFVFISWSSISYLFLLYFDSAKHWTTSNPKFGSLVRFGSSSKGISLAHSSSSWVLIYKISWRRMASQTMHPRTISGNYLSQFSSKMQGNPICLLITLSSSLFLGGPGSWRLEIYDMNIVSLFENRPKSTYWNLSTRKNTILAPIVLFGLDRNRFSVDLL